MKKYCLLPGRSYQRDIKSAILIRFKTGREIAVWTIFYLTPKMLLHCKDIFQRTSKKLSLLFCGIFSEMDLQKYMKHCKSSEV